jgi:hypothetical protein
MLSERLRRPEAGEQGRWWSTTEILTLLQQAYGKSTLASVTPKKIGDLLGSRQFKVESKHTNSGTKYLLVER